MISGFGLPPRLAGVCGSDLATVYAMNSPYLAPVTSLPFVLGHELVGHVTEVGPDAGGRIGRRSGGVAPGAGLSSSGAGAAVRRVCCGARCSVPELDSRGCPPPACRPAFGRDTGGAFGTNLVAHRSQVYRIPDDIPDRAAVLTEPFACAAARCPASFADRAGHGVGNRVRGDRAVDDCGAARHGLPSADSGRRSATLISRSMLCGWGRANCWSLPPGVRERYALWAKALDAEVLKPELGKPLVVGGASVTFDCAASATTIDDGIRFTRSGGTFVLVGMPGMPRGIDWTPLWFKELTLCAAYAYGPEETSEGHRETFDVAVDLLREWAPKIAAAGR